MRGRAGSARSIGTAVAVCIALLPVASASGAAGDLDGGFSQNGLAVAPRSYGFDTVAVEPQGRKVILATAKGIVRFASDGREDHDFNARAAQALANVGTGSVTRDVVIDGRDQILVLVGQSGADPSERLVRLTPDGSVDRSFGGERGIAVGQGETGAIAIDESGQIAVAAGTEIRRLSPDGQLVTGFGSGGSVDVQAVWNAVALREDGAVVGLEDYAVVQFRPDGQLDSSFGSDSGFGTSREPGFGRSSDIDLGPEDSLYLLDTDCVDIPYIICSQSVGKFDVHGVRDPSFSYIRYGDTEVSHANAIQRNGLAVDSQGGAVVADADLDGYRGLMVAERFTPLGKADPDFGGGDGIITVFPGGCTGEASRTAFDADGRPLIAVTACGRAGVVRLRTGGERTNLDADPFDDDKDRCFRFPSTAHLGCGVSIRHLVVRKNSFGGIRGRIRDRSFVPPASNPHRIPPPPIIEVSPCGRHVPVELYRARPGRDLLVGSSSSTHQGRFRFHRRVRSGRYYVKAPGTFYKESSLLGASAWCGLTRTVIRG